MVKQPFLFKLCAWIAVLSLALMPTITGYSNAIPSQQPAFPPAAASQQALSGLTQAPPALQPAVAPPTNHNPYPGETRPGGPIRPDRHEREAGLLPAGRFPELQASPLVSERPDPDRFPPGWETGPFSPQSGRITETLDQLRQQPAGGKDGQALEESLPSAEPALSIQGFVLDAQGIGKAGLTLHAALPAGETVSAVTGAAGHFEFALPPLGAYHLSVLDVDGSLLAVQNETMAWISPAHIESPELHVIRLAARAAKQTEGDSIYGIDAAVAEGGQITGQVSAEENGTPIAGALVSAYGANSNSYGFTTTDVSGVYTLTALPDYEYRVQFSAPQICDMSGCRPENFVTEYYNDKLTYAAGDLVTVHPGDTIQNIDAALARGGTISGKVTSEKDGTPVANVSIHAYTSTGYSQYAWTNASGEYVLYGLLPGSYSIQFTPHAICGVVECIPTEFIAEYYNNHLNASEADPVVVTANETTSEINAALAVGGKITGQLTSESNGAPVKNAPIRVYKPDGSSVYASSNEYGIYTVTGLAGGSYRLRFSSPNCFGEPECIPYQYIAEYYNNKSSLEDADPVTVTSGETTSGVNAALASAASVSGKVTSASTGEPLPGVEAYMVDANYNNYWAYTDSSGVYTVRGLLPGSYRLEFYTVYSSSSFTRDHISEYYKDKTNWEEADLVNVSAGQVRGGMDAVLELGGKITGMVTANDTGQGLCDVDVYVEIDYGPYYYSRTSTAADGTYTMVGLPTGDYTVEFSTWYSSIEETRQYVSEYFENKTSSWEAGIVSVTQGSVTSNINAGLERGGRISGTVTSTDTHKPLPETNVYVYDENGNEVDSLSTSIAGEYTTSPLLAGKYSLLFETDPQGASAGYASEYYNNRYSWYTADLVTVEGAKTTRTDIALQPGSQISGEVRSAGNNQPLEGVFVYAYPASDRYERGMIRSAQTDSAGKYSLQGVNNGAYKVQIQPPDESVYAGEWFNHRSSFGTASNVIIFNGKAVSGIDAVLEVGGKITGKVTAGDTGQPLENAWVELYDEDGRYDRYTRTGSDGVYTFTGLASGSYQVSFWADDYVNEIYDDTQSWEAAQGVQVTLGATTSGIDAIMDRGGLVTGQLKKADSGTGMRGYIDVYNDTGELILSQGSYHNGKYELLLRPGSYRLYFSPTWEETNQYVGEYYNNALSLDEATPVSIQTGGQTTIDAALDLGGQIAGKVTNSSGQPLPDLTVSAYDTNGNFQGSGWTGEDGQYITTALANGSYRLLFKPWESGASDAYLAEYYNDQASLETAVPVAVTSNQVHENINAQLQGVVASLSTATLTLSENVGSATITLNLNVASPFEVTVPYRVSGWAAGGGVDHSLTDGQFVFAPKSTSSSVSFTVKEDTIDETDESIIVTLESPLHALLGANKTLTITIQDNDQPSTTLPAPGLTSLLPAQGRADMATEINILGTNFATGAVATLKSGEQSLSLSTSWVSATRLLATIPAGITPAVYSLTVVNPDGQQASLANAYQAMPAASEDLFGYAYEFWTEPSTIYANTSISLGLVVQHSGGTETLLNLPVNFYLGDPNSGGKLIGTSKISSLPPRSWASTSSLAWTTPAAGTYTLVAVIDPGQTITETIETNNTLSRTITVNPAPASQTDLTAPVVDQFSTQTGAVTTTSPDVSLSVKASDIKPGSGVQWVMFVEYDFNESSGQWVQAQSSTWMTYTVSNNYAWQLNPPAGSKYLQAWVADGAGNVSSDPASLFINYIPEADTLARGQSRYYVYRLEAGQTFAAKVTPLSGDADLYVWAPDFQRREPWSSIASSGEDQVSFNAPVTGLYVMQVYGYTGTTYRLTLNPSSSSAEGRIEAPKNEPDGTGLNIPKLGETVEKTLLTEPILAPGVAPSSERSILDAPLPARDTYKYLYLPTIVRK